MQIGCLGSLLLVYLRYNTIPESHFVTSKVQHHGFIVETWFSDHINGRVGLLLAPSSSPVLPPVGESKVSHLPE